MRDSGVSVHTKTKSIELASLTLKNFKGIRDFTANFAHYSSVRGANATGKTTLNDAFRWLLFDKDSTDRTAFEIKTLDSANNPIPAIEHSVTGVLMVNGKPKTFQKTLKEKWQKKRGEAEATFTGNEVLYFVNDVPCQMKEYKEQVADLVDELTFKIITDPLYFSQTMKWQDRRAVLLSVIGDIEDEQVISYNSRLEGLRELLTDTDIETLRKQLAARKKKLNDEIKSIPYRIDECNNSIKEIDVKELKKEIKSIDKKIEELDEEILTKMKPDSSVIEKRGVMLGLRNKINSLGSIAETEYYSLLSEVQQGLRQSRMTLMKDEAHLKDITAKLFTNKTVKEGLEKSILNFRKDWQTEYEKQFIIDEDFTCPTCKRALDPDTIEEKKQQLNSNFNLKKAEILSSISNKGKTSSTELTTLEKEIENLQRNIVTTESCIEELTQHIVELVKKEREIQSAGIIYPQELRDLEAEAEILKNELAVPSGVNNTVELQGKKRELAVKRDSAKKELAQEDTNMQMIARVKELSDKERDLARQIATLESQEFMSEEFIKTKVELLESRINSKFRNVSFKMFNVLINSGITETCIPLINGVPFTDANNAARINAGLDIINTLSEHYGVTAPVFLDNRESVIELIPTPAQVINLIVTEHEQLTIS